MQKIENFLDNLISRSKDFYKKYKKTSILIILILVFLILWLLSGVFNPHRRFVQHIRGDRSPMGFAQNNHNKNQGQSKLQGQGPQRLYDRFCSGDNGQKFMMDPRGFRGEFSRGVDKRIDKIDPIRQHLQNIISQLKSKSYDTTDLETKLQQIDSLIIEFQSGKQGFELTPQDFCQNQSGRIELNDKIKTIMTGILEEIEKIEK